MAIVAVPVIEDTALAPMRLLKEVILIVADTESVTGVIETGTQTKTATASETEETRNGTETVIVIVTESEIKLVCISPGLGV